MTLEFKPLSVEDKKELEDYFKLNGNVSCEYNFNTIYLWNNLYKTHFYKTDNYVIFLNQYLDQYYSMMPLAKEEYYSEAFEIIWQYFNEELKMKLPMYAVEEKFAKHIIENYKDKFTVTKDRDNFDYIYSAEELRTLVGKKFNKKRNHVNAFMRDYEGRYEYRPITTDHLDEVMECLERWNDEKELIISNQLKAESKGIENVINNLDFLDMRAGGIWIDNKLEAFTIGSYSNNKTEAIIHSEKANYNIRGLYAAINQIFLQKAYPNIETVNREDDLGIPGIRKAKMSYRPIKLLKKYNIFQI